MPDALPFVRSLALLVVHCLQMWLCFAFLGGFQRVLCVWCGFVLSWCFAWLVWLLCACGVRRIKGLRRVCLHFSFSLSLSCPFTPVFASFYARCPSLLWLSFFCPLALSLLFLFPFRTKRKRAHLFCALSLLGFGVFILSYLMQ